MSIKTFVFGADGRMGKEVVKVLSESSGFIMVDEDEDIDVIIDFSNHAATGDLLALARNKSAALVIATTGQTKEEMEAIREASKSLPLFYSANMSIGIALLKELVEKTVEVFKDADINIIESHHNRKLDAPSGTALILSGAIEEVNPSAHIETHSIRSGNIVGIHEVIVGTDTQSISLKHEAHDRKLFAEGAVRAAGFIVNKTPGYYEMKDLLKEGSEEKLWK